MLGGGYWQGKLSLYEKGKKGKKGVAHDPGVLGRIMAKHGAQMILRFLVLLTQRK